MSYEFYKVAHVVGLACLVLGLGIGIAYFVTSGSKANKSLKIWTFALHGVGLALLLVSGFGLLVKLGFATSIPGWVYAKLVIWGAMALMISVIKRRAQWFPMTSLLIVLLVGLAASFAITKPF